MATERRGEVWIECRSCDNGYSAKGNGGICPFCGHDAFVDLIHALDPLRHTAKAMRKRDADPESDK